MVRMPQLSVIVKVGESEDNEEGRNKKIWMEGIAYVYVTNELH